MVTAEMAMLLAPPLGYLFAAVWGALWGSFFNVAIHRLAREDASLKMLVSPPSHCPSCNAPVRAWDNVPLLSWLLLGGKCRACKAPIAVRYPLVELAGVLLALAVYQVFVVGHPDAVPLMLSRFFLYFSFAGTLFVLAMIDLDTFLLPDAITLPAIPVFFLAGRVVRDVSLLDALLGMAAGYGLFKALEIGYPLFSRWRRRRRIRGQAQVEGWDEARTRAAVEEEQGIDGLGGGDAKLMALVGGLLGWGSLPVSVGLGSMLGVAIVLPRVVTLWLAQRKSPPPETTNADGEGDGDADGEGDGEARSLGEMEIPYGPFLVAGTLSYLFLKDVIWRALQAWVDQP